MSTCICVSAQADGELGSYMRFIEDIAKENACKENIHRATTIWQGINIFVLFTDPLMFTSVKFCYCLFLTLMSQIFV